MSPPHRFLAAALTAAGLLSACREQDSLLRRKERCNDAGDCITRVRGIQGHHRVPELAGAPRPVGGGAAARILVQPLEKRFTRGRTVWALYVRDPDLTRRVRAALEAAQPAPYRTCEPAWRVDVRYGPHTHLVRINVPCRRLEVDGRDLAYDDNVKAILGPLLRRASLRPDHKILRIRVPVEHDPQLVLKALANRTVESYLPQRFAPRGPVVQVDYTVQRRAPKNPTQYDKAVAALRAQATDRLKAYARQLKVGRHEVLEVLGPDPVHERFHAPLFEARYGVTVYFKHGTPQYMLGFLGLGNDFVVRKVTHPKDYRVDAVFAGKTRWSQMRKVLRWVPVKPRLRRW